MCPSCILLGSSYQFLVFPIDYDYNSLMYLYEDVVVVLKNLLPRAGP